jgi:polysaccharide biosynthesis protein PslG
MRNLRWAQGAVMAMLITATTFSSSFAKDSWPSNILPNSFGTDVHFVGDNPTEFAMMQKAGVKVLRIKMPWTMVEKKVGVYNFSAFQAMVAGMKPYGIRPLIMIGFGNQLYKETMSCRTKAGLAAYAKMSEAAAAALKGNGVIWELWNEPNLDGFWRPKSNSAEYMTWVKTVTPAIRKGDPEALVVGPALSNVFTPFMGQLLKAGLVNYVDGISVHPYQYKNNPELGEKDLKNLRNLIKTTSPQNPNIPIMFTEWGYSVSAADGFDEETQAKYLSRQFLLGAMYGVPINIWYNWKNSRTEPCVTKDKCYGMVKNNLEQRLAYKEMIRVTQELDGFKYISRLKTSTSDYILVFAKGNVYKVAAWTTAPEHVSPELAKVMKQTSSLLRDTPAFYTVN